MGLSIKELFTYISKMQHSGERGGRKLSLRLLRKLPVVDSFLSGGVVLEERLIGRRPSGKGLRTIIHTQLTLLKSLTDERNSPSTEFNLKEKSVMITHRRSLLHR